MTSNGGGLKITEKCKIPGYKYLVWYSKKAITNIICQSKSIWLTASSTTAMQRCIAS